jgi:hypothetical protein
MAMWAGVQNVSRPMERCQEMSHWPPIMAEVTPKTAHQTYQGTRATDSCAVEMDETVVEMVAMLLPLYVYDYILVRIPEGGIHPARGFSPADYPSTSNAAPGAVKSSASPGTPADKRS